MIKENLEHHQGKLAVNLVTSLKWFGEGHCIDLCVDICNQFGKLFPSEKLGQTIKNSHLSGLMVRGYIATETVVIFRIQYTRFRITSFGKQWLEENGYV